MDWQHELRKGPEPRHRKKRGRERRILRPILLPARCRQSSWYRHVAFRSDLDRAWLCSSLLKPSATLQLKLHRATSKMLDIGQPAPRQVIEMSFPSSSKLWEFQDSAFSPFSASALSFAQTYSLRRQAFCFRDAEAVIRNRSGEAVWGLPCQFTSPV